MWGTLIEQYPYLISKILVINSPTFMNVLWTACSAFIPAEYRRKIILFGEKWQEKITAHVTLPYLPISYGGYLDVNIKHPTPFDINSQFAITQINDDSLETLIVPAGGYTIQTFYLKQDEVLEFYMFHDQEFTMNIFFSESKRVKIAK
uniref:CRAL-TRIO domain-containing protein n=1 Tax=Acrobeloides nanus TaxID=290746 RepID=A0A914CJI6_9BILA